MPVALAGLPVATTIVLPGIIVLILIVVLILWLL